MYKNIFYLSNLGVIGGVETMQYELARKYQDSDITVYYKTGTDEQVKRLRKYVRVKKYNGEKIACDNFFIHYDLDVLDNVEAKEIVRIVHYLAKTQKNTPKPKIHPKITRHIAVSKTAATEWEEVTGIKCEVVRNPLQILDEERKPALILISATRLTQEKGKDRIIKLGKLLDEAGINYLWLIFTDDRNAINNKNIVYMQPRLDIRPFIASVKGNGYGVQLSDCERRLLFCKRMRSIGSTTYSYTN